MADAALLVAVAARDTRAFERLYKKHQRRVWSYAVSLVRDAATAEELVVDTMLAVWRGAPGFRAGSRVSTWILGITRHKALDALRRSDRRRREVDLEEALELPADGPGPADDADRADTSRLVQRAMVSLSAEHREALHLAFEEELPYQEIATLLDLPENTVKTRVFYAKRKLREQMERLTAREPPP